MKIEEHTIASRLTSKGQVTLPVAIRRRLGLQASDRVAFHIDEQGQVSLSALRYPDIDSLAGAAGSLDEPKTISQMRDIAYADRYMSEGDD